jgi:signal transduction histidine kinase
LRPTVLDDFGLATALRLQVQRLRDEGLRVSYEETLGGGRLPEVVETTLFRVAQEALTNVRKHARTDRAHVALERRDQGVRLQVRDWGRGFAPDGATDGADPGEQVGLSSMRERVALLAGHLEIISKPGDGTLVVAEVPLQEETDTEGDVDYGE